MIFETFGDSDKPAVLLIHGGGLSYWMWQPQIDALLPDYYVIAPVLDGHGEESETEFKSIAKSAVQILDYVERNCGGKVFAVCGLSIGAQITVELLSRSNDLAEKAIIESAMVIPEKWVALLAKPMLDCSWFLTKKRWFAKLQAKQMYISDGMFDDYFRDSTVMSKQSMVQMLIDNARYCLPELIKNTTADTLILYGEDEIGAMKKSAELLHRAIEGSRLQAIPNCGHGFSIRSPQEYIEVMREHFTV